MEKKYRLMAKEFGGYPIKALRDFGDVKAGDTGGFIDSEDCLSQEGNCWVYPSGRVQGEGVVSNNARVYGTVRGSNVVMAQVRDNAVVEKGATVTHDAIVGGYTTVEEGAEIGMHARVFDDYDYILVGDTTAYETEEPLGPWMCRAGLYGPLEKDCDKDSEAEYAVASAFFYTRYKAIRYQLKEEGRMLLDVYEPDYCGGLTRSDIIRIVEDLPDGKLEQAAMLMESLLREEE